MGFSLLSAVLPRRTVDLPTPPPVSGRVARELTEKITGAIRPMSIRASNAAPITVSDVDVGFFGEVKGKSKNQILLLFFSRIAVASESLTNALHDTKNDNVRVEILKRWLEDWEIHQVALRRVNCAMLHGLDFGKIPPQLRYFSHIKILDLSGNNIVDVTKEAVETLTRVEWVSLADNQIASLPRKDFINSDRILFLSFARNQIVHLKKTTFEHLGSLRHLDISGNRMVSLAKGVFEALRQLQILVVDQEVADRHPEILGELPSSCCVSREHTASKVS
jgi:hypothetical protein